MNTERSVYLKFTDSQASYQYFCNDDVRYPEQGASVLPKHDALSCRNACLGAAIAVPLYSMTMGGVYTVSMQIWRRALQHPMRRCLMDTAATTCCPPCHSQRKMGTQAWLVAQIWRGVDRSQPASAMLVLMSATTRRRQMVVHLKVATALISYHLFHYRTCFFSSSSSTMVAVDLGCSVNISEVQVFSLSASNSIG